MTIGTSLVVQWLRICLSMQGTQGGCLVQEDATCLRSTKAHTPQLLSLSVSEPVTLEKPLPRAHAATRERPLCAATREDPAHSDGDSAQPNIFYNDNNSKY